jgi:hypothetical protein
MAEIKKFCLTSDKEKGGQVEIMEVQEPRADGTFGLSSKTVHEVKSTGNPQNDTITYDLVKLLIVTLLDNDVDVDESNQGTFGMMLALNTLLEAGMIYEIE